MNVRGGLLAGSAKVATPAGRPQPRRDLASGSPRRWASAAPSSRIARGFTLIEILVALALAAVALAAGMRALAQAADGAGTLKARTLALWVAQNRLAAIQLAPDSLASAGTQGQAVQAGVSFLWKTTVSGTPNPAFRRVDIVVAEAAVPDYALARLTGYVTGIAP